MRRIFPVYGNAFAKFVARRASGHRAAIGVCIVCKNKLHGNRPRNFFGDICRACRVGCGCPFEVPVLFCASTAMPHQKAKIHTKSNTNDNLPE